MRKIEGEQVLMRIFIGESDHWQRRPLFTADLPLVIEVVDTEEHLQAVLPDVDRMMSGGLITMEKVRVVRYERGDRGR